MPGLPGRRDLALDGAPTWLQMAHRQLRPPLRRVERSRPDARPWTVSVCSTSASSKRPRGWLRNSF